MSYYLSIYLLIGLSFFGKVNSGSENSYLINGCKSIINQTIKNDSISGFKNIYPLSPFSHKIIDLTSSNKSIKWAMHINEKSQVAGMHAFNSRNHLFCWDGNEEYIFMPDQRKQYGIRAGGAPFINNKGLVSDYPINDKGDKYFITNKRLWKNNKILEETLSWEETEYLCVNNTGLVLASIRTSSNRSELIIFDELKGTITYIGKCFKFDIYPADINDHGSIIGWFHDGNNQQGIFWSINTGLIVIKDFCPTAINNHNVVAGCITSPIKRKRGALWYNGEIIDVNEALHIEKNYSTSLLYINEISDINDRGEMVGWGIRNSHLAQQAIVILQNSYS